VTIEASLEDIHNQNAVLLAQGERTHEDLGTILQGVRMLTADVLPGWALERVSPGYHLLLIPGGDQRSQLAVRITVPESRSYGDLEILDPTYAPLWRKRFVRR
jgi:hypothetical protein